MSNIVLPDGSPASPNWNEVCCSTADEFLDAIAPRGTHLSVREEPRAWLFRGHGDEAWELVPSALRRDGDLQKITLGEKPIETNREQIQAERKLITAFFVESDASGLRIPEDSQEMRKRLSELWEEKYVEKLASGDELWPPYFLYSLLALIQHHGLPTRLLDWTFDSKIAAYFAAESAAFRLYDGYEEASVVKERLAVWAFSRDAFKAFRDDEARDGTWIPTVEINAPLAEIRNLHAQKGVFILNRSIGIVLDDPVDRTPLDRMLRGRANTVIDYPIFQKFTLPISQAGKLLWLLAIEGIVGSRLFPGYDGVTKAIREQRFWRRPINPIDVPGPRG